MIKLIYLSPWPVGGFASFTHHFVRALEEEEIEYEVLRCNLDKHEDKSRLVKNQNFSYRHCTVKEVVKSIDKETPHIITAVARPEDCKDPKTMQKLIDAGAYVCVQSTQELKQFPHVATLGESTSRIVVIRKSLRKHFPHAKYLPHPYVRTYDDSVFEKRGEDGRKRACSIAMLAKNKHMEILFGASAMVKYARDRVRPIGRLTTHFLGMELAKKYPLIYERPPGFSASTTAAWHALHYELAVDLSDYPGDGGGTQYCFLEAADGGAVNVLHRNWTDVKGDMVEGENCLAVASAEELRDILESKSLRHGKKEYEMLRQNSRELLRMHGPQEFVRALKQVLR